MRVVIAFLLSTLLAVTTAYYSNGGPSYNSGQRSSSYGSPRSGYSNAGGTTGYGYDAESLGGYSKPRSYGNSGYGNGGYGKGGYGNSGYSNGGYSNGGYSNGGYSHGARRGYSGPSSGGSQGSYGQGKGYNQGGGGGSPGYGGGYGSSDGSYPPPISQYGPSSDSSSYGGSSYGDSSDYEQTDYPVYDTNGDGDKLSSLLGGYQLEGSNGEALELESLAKDPKVLAQVIKQLGR